MVGKESSKQRRIGCHFASAWFDFECSTYFKYLNLLYCCQKHLRLLLKLSPKWIPLTKMTVWWTRRASLRREHSDLYLCLNWQAQLAV